MEKPNKLSTTEELARWNDKMVKLYHQEGTIFKSKNPIVRILEKMRLRKIIKFAQIKNNNKILDLGCGEGYLISLLPDEISIVGIDISPTALNQAKETFKNKKNVSFELGNAYKLDYPEKYFDRIICSEVLEHIPDPRRVIEEIHRLLKDDGLAIISIPDEKRIQKIMSIIQFFGLEKFVHAARKQKEYEWHLHSANKKFLREISNNLLEIRKIARTPAIIGYRFVASLKKIYILPLNYYFMKFINQFFVL